MFSIPVSELTVEILSKAEYWRLFAQMADGRMWADTRHRDSLCILPAEESPYPLMDRHSDFNAYAGHVRCFPVTLSPDGTEARLECPRMPDEVEIPWGLLRRNWQYELMDTPTVFGVKKYYLFARKNHYESHSTEALLGPTPEHSPRLSLEGVWVWSTRR